MSLSLRVNCGVSHDKKNEHEAVGLTQQPRGERKGGLSGATDQPYFCPATQSGSHEQFNDWRMSSRPSTSKYYRRTASVQVNNGNLPPIEDWRPGDHAQGAYALAALNDTQTDSSKHCLMMYIGHECTWYATMNSSDDTCSAMTCKFDSIAGSVSQVLQITSSCGSMHLPPGLLGHYGGQVERASATQDTVPASVRGEKNDGSIMKEQNMIEQMKEDSRTKPTEEPCLLGTKSPPTAATGSESEPHAHQMLAMERIRAEILPAGNRFRDVTIGDKTYFVEAP